MPVNDVIRRIFGRKKRPAPVPRKPTVRTVDDDETIIIDLSGSQPEEEVRIVIDPDDRDPDDRPGDGAQGDAPTDTFDVAEPGAVAGDDSDETIVISTRDMEQGAAAGGEQVQQRANVSAAWLCVVSDHQFGRSFTVSLGRNRIGRGDGNHIRMDIGDSMISKRDHASIVADPKTRTFHIVPGESANLAYLNEQPVLQPQQLSDRDRIQIGMTEFIFVQYFGNYVDWR